MTYQLTIYGEPKAQPRPRAFARKMGNKYVARMYDADTAQAWKRCVLIECQRSIRPADLSDRQSLVKVNLCLFLKRPKAHLLSDGRLTKRAPAAHTQKPDVDNLAKAVLDAVTDSGRFWVDDSQIVELTVAKKWTTGRPGCFLEIKM